MLGVVQVVREVSEETVVQTGKDGIIVPGLDQLLQEVLTC